MFENVASVLPEQTLEVIEKSGKQLARKFGIKKDMFYDRLVRLLRLIAYDPNLFTRSTYLIISLNISINASDKRNYNYDLLKSLFPIKLSGNWARIDERLSIIKNLWQSGLEQKQELSLLLLGACLESVRFGSNYSFSFGSRSRNYGYFPDSDDEVVDWFTKTVQLATEFGLSPFGKAEKARTILADKLRGLWGQTLLRDLVEETCLNILSRIGYWQEGWLAVGKIIMFNKMKDNSEGYERLASLHTKMKYSNLVEHVRTYISLHPEEQKISELEGDSSSQFDFIESVVDLGKRLTNDDLAFSILIPELVFGSSFSVYHIGHGLFNGAKEKEVVWQKLEKQFCLTDKDHRNINILKGWLRGAYDQNTALLEEKLDYILENQFLSRYFIRLQCAVPITNSGYLRVCKSLEKNFVDVNDYNEIGWMIDFLSVSYNDFSDLLVKIAQKEGGMIIALELLHRHLRGSEPPLDEHNRKVLVSVARRLLGQREWNKDTYSRSSFDYNLSQIIEDCLSGEEAILAAEIFLTNLIYALRHEHIYMYEFDFTIKGIIKCQPNIVLDLILLNTTNFSWILEQSQGFRSYDERHLLENFADAQLICWCDKEPEHRCELLLGIMSFFYLDEFEKVAVRSFFYYLIENINDINKVFTTVEGQIEPMSYSGNLADILEVRLVLFVELSKSTNHALSIWANEICTSLESKILFERKRDLIDRRLCSGSFE